MKYLIVLMFFISNTYAKLPAPPIYKLNNSLKVLTLNTWLIPIIGEKARTRAKLIGKELQTYDMAFMQEVFLNKDRRRILKNLNAGRDKFYHEYEKGAVLKLSPGLLSVSKYPITQSNFMKFSDCLDEQCYAKKGILHTRIKLSSNLEVDIYNGHFQPFSSGDTTRTKQMQQSISFVNKTNGGKRPSIFIGDFNTANPRADMIKALEKEGFRDAWVESRGGDPGYTWDSFINLWSRKIDRTKFGQHRLDYIFVRGSEQIDILTESAKIVFDKPLPLKGDNEVMFISDHFGIELNIQFF